MRIDGFERSLLPQNGVEVVCRHEPYQGRCVHCDISFRDGQPYHGEPSPDPRDAELEKLRRIVGMIPANAHQVERIDEETVRLTIRQDGGITDIAEGPLRFIVNWMLRDLDGPDTCLGVRAVRPAKADHRL